jgi:hypothetical protein
MAEQTGTNFSYILPSMRPIVILAVFLSVVCSPSMILHAGATITVDEDLSAIHHCAQTSLHFNERDGVATFELTRSGNTTGTTTGYVKIPELGHFNPHLKLTARFAPGETTRFVDFRWDDNSVYDGHLRSRFICGGEGPGVSSSTSEGTITLSDDEPYPTMIAPESVEVTETDTTQLITIPISFVPPFAYHPDVRVVLEHVTTDDRDLKALPNSYPFDGIDLEIQGDDLPEHDETLSVRLTGAVQKWISLTIRDDERPPFPYKFDQEHYEFDEVSVGSVVVQRTGSLSSAAELQLNIRPTIRGAVVEVIPVVFIAGESSKEVSFVLDDTSFTGTRNGMVELEFAGFVGATASLTVNDDEAMPSLSIGDASVREGNLDQHPRLLVPLTLTGSVGVPIEVRVSASHVSTDADDFAAVSQTVIISPGLLTGTAAFDVHGDIVLEPDETFNVTITSCCDGMAVVVRPTATATIVNDDEAPTETIYRLALGATKFHEYNQWLSIPVRRFGRVTGTTQAILKLTAADERFFAPRTVSFAPNETVNDVRFFIDDFWHSGNTVVKVELIDEDRILETASVTILDNEESPRAWIYGGTAREGNASRTVPFTVRQYPPSGRPLILHLRARSGTAAYGDDFPPFDKIVEIPPRTSDYELAVPIRDDRLPEKTENFILDILAADGSGGGTTPFPASIEDDDTVWVESEPYVLRGALTTITVHLANPAPSKDVIHFYADPNSLEGPLTVPVPIGASSVSFQALAKRTGDTAFAIETPAFVTSTRIPKKVIIFDQHTVTLTPAALELAPGTFARIVLTIGPGSAVGFTPQSSEWSIAAIQAAAPVDGKPSFLVHGINPGQTEILVKLPASVGGATARLPVVVKEPVVPVIRKRAARH